MFNLFTQCTICHQTGLVLCLKCQRHLNIYHGESDLNDMGNLAGLIIGRHYDRIVRHLVHRLKYGRGKAIANTLGCKLATIIHTSDLIDQIQLYPGQVIITAVPTHRFKRYFTRGYNQAELLAQSIASSLNLPYQELLYKSRWTTSQVKVSRASRLINIINSFSSSPTISLDENSSNNPKESQKNTTGKIIILVDDIITTGTTISECARILHEYYPHSQIRGVCIARNR